jgi:transglutaminase-like putative cysteine protease
MTFTNYFVNLYKVEGTITWLNTSTPNTRSWTRTTTGGKITAPDARFWLHEGTRSVTQTAGVGTPTPIDDIFLVTSGTHTVTNASNISRTCTILESLQRKVACSNIDKGKIKVQGPNHYATIDFGDGTCDNLASLSIDGRTPRTIVLR